MSARYKIMGGTSYPGFFDHLPYRLNCGVEIVSRKIVENAKGSNFSASRETVSVIYTSEGCMTHLRVLNLIKRSANCAYSQEIVRWK